MIAPPHNGSFWLRLDGAETSSWLEAKMIAASAFKSSGVFWTRRRVRLHLRFSEPCPYDFFKAAIDGFAREIPRSLIPSAMLKRYDGRYWR